MADDNTGRRRFPRRMYLLSGMFFFIFMGAGAQQVFIVPYLGRVTDWSTVRCSTVVATVYATMIIFRVLNIYLFRKWSDRTFTIVGSFGYLFFNLFMLATAYVKSYPLALVCAFVWGICGALMWTGTTMQTLAAADEAGGKHGTGMGILYGSTHAGWVTGVIILGIIYRSLSDGSLPLLYVCATGMTLVGNIMAFFLPPTEGVVRETPSVGDLIEIATKRKAMIAGLLQLMAALAFGLILGAFGKYIQDRYGAEWIWIAALFYPGTRMVMSLVGGYLTDRVGPVVVLCTTFAAGACGLAVSVLWASPYAAIVTSFTLGLLSSTVPVVAGAIVGSSASKGRRPVVYGIIFAWRDLGVAAAAVGVNILGLKMGFDAAFTVFIVVFVGCAFASLYLGRFAEEKL